MSYYLRVSVTDRCQLRCTYCLPEHARFAPDRAEPDELCQLIDCIHASVGVHKIRLTGGEPTLNPHLSRYVAHARHVVGTVGLTTNGLLLSDQLPDLVNAGLNRLNISLDAVDEAGFRHFSRRDGLPAVLRAINQAQQLGLQPIKINCVAMQDTDLVAMVQFAAFHNLHVRFIELMAIGEARPWQAQAYISSHDIRDRLASAGILLQAAPDCDEPTSRVYAVAGHDLFDTSVGFITTVSQPFCASCDRLRLSSQGRLYTCLMDDTGHDLLRALRTDGPAAVHECVRAAVASKAPPLVMERATVMAEIGG